MPESWEYPRYQDWEYPKYQVPTSVMKKDTHKPSQPGRENKFSNDPRWKCEWKLNLRKPPENPHKSLLWPCGSPFSHKATMLCFFSKTAKISINWKKILSWWLSNGLHQSFLDHLKVGVCTVDPHSQSAAMSCCAHPETWSPQALQKTVPVAMMAFPGATMHTLFFNLVFCQLSSQWLIPPAKDIFQKADQAAQLTVGRFKGQLCKTKN